MSDEKRNVQLRPNDMGLAEHKRRDFVVDVDHGTTLEDVLKPEFWTHVVAYHGVQLFDTIMVRAKDGSFMAELYVTGVGIHRLVVKVLQKYEFAVAKKAETSPDGENIVEWGGPAHKWRIKRKSDNAIIEKGFTSEPEAVDWLEKQAA